MHTFAVKLKKVFFLLAALLSALFYITCVFFAYAGVSWLWIWPLLSVFCAARFLMLHFNIHLPKALRVIYYTLLILFVCLFVFTEAKIISAMNTVPESGLDYIITLGASVRNGRPSSPLLLRIEATENYLIENPNTVAIASGGQGANEAMSEAACIKQYLVAGGIDEARVILEDSSTDTFENLRNSFALIPEGARVGIVTSSFHLYRAMRQAELMGHPVSGIPAHALLPLRIHYTVREFFAVVELELKNLL